jgi:hypothetical protein
VDATDIKLRRKRVGSYKNYLSRTGKNQVAL